MKSDSSDYHAMDEWELARRRGDEYARQEEMMEQIYTGVKGLRQQAGEINDHVEMDIKLIDDLDRRMDSADHGLKQAEAKARQVNVKKSKVCKLYGIIVLLVIVEIVISYIPGMVNIWGK